MPYTYVFSESNKPLNKTELLILLSRKMATALSNTTTSANFYNHSTLPLFSPPYQLHRRNIVLIAAPRCLRRLAVAGGPPSPPGPDPPPPEDTTQLAGLILLAHMI